MRYLVSQDYMGQPITLLCDTCGKPFTIARYRCRKDRPQPRFCSNPCRYIGSLRRKKLLCGYCEQPFTVNLYRQNTARFCSSECHDKARIRYPQFHCSMCDLTKTAADFALARTTSRGHDYICKRCRATRSPRSNVSPATREAEIQRNAKQRKLEYSLTHAEFMTFWQEPCFYCGDPIKTIGLDRIDSSKGYILDNLRACCRVCNRMKSSLTADTFVERCRRIGAI